MFGGFGKLVGCAAFAISLFGCQANDGGLKPGVSVTPARGGSGGSRSLGSGGSGGGAMNTGGTPQMMDAAPDVVADSGPDAIVDVARPPVDMRPLEVWKPAMGTTWDYQLVIPTNTTADAQMYVIPLFEVDPGVIKELRTKGKKVMCLIDVGTYDPGDSDAAKIPPQAIGAAYAGDPVRRWLDISNKALLSVMRGRLDVARGLGCHGVVPENMNGWDIKGHEPTGFALTNIDQLLYNRTLAAEAHSRGLTIALKDDIRQVDDQVADFDLYVSEECFDSEQCHLLKPFIDAGKPVFDVEFTLALTAFCPLAKQQKISAIKKTVMLDAHREPCPP